MPAVRLEIREIPPAATAADVAEKIPGVKFKAEPTDALPEDDDRRFTFVSHLQWLAGHSIREAIDQAAVVKAFGTGVNGGDGRRRFLSKRRSHCCVSRRSSWF
jgi:hypothetical protein